MFSSQLHVDQVSHPHTAHIKVLRCHTSCCRFSQWPTQAKARDSSNTHLPRQQQQQQGQANGADHKRKQGDASPGSKAAAAQQQPAAKQQRLERPGKLVGATAAMVVGMQVCLGVDW
jgi:hypothetical protein